MAVEGSCLETEKLYREEMDNKTRTKTQHAKDRAKSGIWTRCRDHRCILYATLAPSFAG